ncbi:hypothetical protein DV515_00014733 [Chloebia gouldiae]|uniref:Kinesin motor domain-containing protein n=1 Tax=Chloebia gouldiae TaxID=44316 RepID=A0A3L8RXP7_CHLGU|nr:hypothetical protein DV515_00014733 [Chloebia gouldiae]
MAAEAVKVAVRCRPLSGREAALGRRAMVGVGSARGRCLVRNPAEPPAVLLGRGVRRGAQHRAHLQPDGPAAGGANQNRKQLRVSWKATIAHLCLWPGWQWEVLHHAGSFLTERDHSRAFEHIFESVQVGEEEILLCTENTKFLLRASYLEIYNEDI